MSKTTPTKINREVPPKNIAKAMFTPKAAAKAGKIAMIPRKMDPGKVILVVTESMKSAVGFPGFIPGIKADFCYLAFVFLIFVKFACQRTANWHWKTACFVIFLQ